MTVLCDLDGVVYRGGQALPGAAEALKRLMSEGTRVLYITNNSTRTPEMAANKITRLAGVLVGPDQIVSSSVATADLLGSDDGPVLVVGEDGVRDVVDKAGLSITAEPTDARTVIVGLTRAIDFEMLAAATTALRSGARFIATNNDPTYPTETGLAPGAGAIVAALAVASGRLPEIAGKPHRPMRQAIRAKGVTEAWVIGDRVDTDIALARDEDDWTSILVLTGVTSAAEAEQSKADFVVADLPAAVDLVLESPPRS